MLLPRRVEPTKFTVGVKLVSCDLYHVIGFKGDLRPPNFARHPPCISSLRRELSHEDEVTFSKPHRIHGDCYIYLLIFH